MSEENVYTLFLFLILMGNVELFLFTSMLATGCVQSLYYAEKAFSLEFLKIFFQEKMLEFLSKAFSSSIK